MDFLGVLVVTTGELGAGNDFLEALLTKIGETSVIGSISLEELLFKELFCTKFCLVALVLVVLSFCFIIFLVSSTVCLSFLALVCLTSLRESGNTGSNVILCFLSFLVFGGASFGSLVKVLNSGGLKDALWGAKDCDADLEDLGSLASDILAFVLADWDLVTLPEVLGFGGGGGGTNFRGLCGTPATNGFFFCRAASFFCLSFSAFHFSNCCLLCSTFDCTLGTGTGLSHFAKFLKLSKTERRLLFLCFKLVSSLFLT